MRHIILLCMFFCHIIDDYKLQQGVLSNLKQKSWWEENYPDEIYKNDYKIALLMHSMSWSFMILIPLITYSLLTSTNLYLDFFIVNTIIHFIIDDLKANKKKINLIQDQTIHLIQIFVTWFIWLN